MFNLIIHHQDAATAARAGSFTTPHGSFRTPAFMPVGTRGTVKGILPAQLRQVGADIILANTYHMALRPGPEVVRDLGDLHDLMAWDGPILTDSGGFQVFSLSRLCKVDDNGVSFRSHIDGSVFEMSPESCMDIQHALGADIIMALDQCPPYPATREQVAEATERSLRWAARCHAHHAPRAGRQALFPIVQGGEFDDLRAHCARLLAEDLPSPGYAIGGVSVGEPHELMMRAVESSIQHLPDDRPRYLMGVGQPRDLLGAIRRGIDMFDCVLPTRNGRNAQAFTFGGLMRLRNQQYERDRRPLEDDCDCPACGGGFSRGAIRHFFQVGEMLGPILVSLHNLRFFARFFEQIRQSIADSRFDAYEKQFLKTFAGQ
jgi:queuine tRNA-ribosyltransferase